mmetsp:Transcript_24518/g.54566  ORF Transcript_24518/g.54566 Transcript_24518/m.54566 type:complete len:299 (+) Transcript_24518:141-1037(+)
MAVPLGYHEPAPLFLGAFPLTVGVQVVCFIHALFCFFVISTVSSVISFDLGGQTISTAFQCCLGSWCCIGIACIVGAFIATKNRAEFPLRVYLYYNMVTTLLILALTGWMLRENMTCNPDSKDRQAQRIGASQKCMMMGATWLCVALAIVGAWAYMTYTVYQFKVFLVQHEEAQHLLVHEDAITKKMRQGKHLGASAVHQRAAANSSGYSEPGIFSSVFGGGGSGADGGYGGGHGQAHGGGNDAFGMSGNQPGYGQSLGLHGDEDSDIDPTLKWAVPTPGLQPGWGTVPIKTSMPYAI